MTPDSPTSPLDLRAPGVPLRLGDLLGYACPELEAGCFGEWVRAGAVSANGRVTRDLGAEIAPGAHVTVEAEAIGPSLRGETWPSLRAAAGHAYVLTIDSPYLRGALPFSTGRGANAELAIAFEVCGRSEGLSELELRWPLERLRGDRPGGEEGDGDADAGAFAAAREVLASLARCGLCVIGDPFHGGIAVEGGPAWRPGAAGSHTDTGAWPDTPAFAEAPPGAARPAWRISEATARVLARGHPWIRLDDDTEDPSIWRPGARVDLVTGDGARHGQALVDGAGRSGVVALRAGDVAARVVAGAQAPAGRDWSIEACVARAVDRRAALLDRLEQTDAIRLVHGDADGVPGVHVDRLGALVRVLVTARCALPWVDRVLVALGSAGPRVVPDPWRVIEVVHLDERVPGRFECVRVHPFSADREGAAALGREMSVREGGLCYEIEPGLAEPERSAPGFGLFLDQRDNRARFAAHAREATGAAGGDGKGRYLNLFAHTGAFSVAWLAAGAGEVVSVDLSAAYLRRLDANLAANANAGVAAERHVAVRQDGRRYLERLTEADRFDGIVLDPPTAAAAGRRFFSVRKDAVPMIALCLAHLVPGGRLLVTLNDRKARRRLEGAIREAAASAGVAIDSLEPAPPSTDFPRLEGFDEGDSFRGCFVRVG